jgi:hypothetical protein
MNKATVLRLLQEGKHHLAREWHFYLDDMIAFAGNVQTYTDGLDQE